MAYKWPDKNPDHTTDYSVDWSRIIEDDYISSVEWYISNNRVESATPMEGLQPVWPTGITNTNTVATIRFNEGTPNKRYTIKCIITTQAGLDHSEEIHLRVREGA